MPIYEYLAVEDGCETCLGRFEVLQSIHDPDIEKCPVCGAAVKRTVSSAQIKVAKFHGADHAAQKGLTTFKRVEEGKWEKVAGPGADMIVGTPEDMAKVKAEKKPPKRFDL